jgi:glycopeptide antibiotics resistance protein
MSNSMTAEPTPAAREWARWALLAYLAVLAVLVFAPLGRGVDLGGRINLEPFATIDRALELGPRSVSFRLMLGNIAAFVPLGILLPLLVRARFSGVLVLLGALALSVAIEVTQFAISVGLGYAYRSTDVDDVVLNVCGALGGYFVYTIYSAFKELTQAQSSR